MDGLIVKVGKVADGLKKMSKIVITSVSGAIDLFAGVKRITVATSIVRKTVSQDTKKCTLPLTGSKCVSDIVTEICYLEVTQGGLVLKEIAPGYTVEDIKSSTEADLIIPDEITVMK